MLICILAFSAIKVNCNGFCGITTKVNDTAWMVEEQYFNSTISVADKGTVLLACSLHWLLTILFTVYLAPQACFKLCWQIITIVWVYLFEVPKVLG